MSVKLMYSASLSRPRNPNAINPYADVEYVLSGSARLIFKRTRAERYGRGEELLQALGGWTPDSAELLEALASWEPDNSFSIYH
jgi:hypothetical protein